MSTWILRGEAARDARRAGGKAAALARLESRVGGAEIPAWFVLTPEAALDGPNAETLERGDPDAQAAQLEVSDAVRAALEAAVAALRPGSAGVAVRSSAVDEDGSGHSFAGQFESYLFCPPERVAERVLQVWRSAFTARVRSYRAERGIEAGHRLPAVLIQRMVDAEYAGVAFSADAASGRRNVAVVSAVRGLGSALVAGEVDADTYRVDTHGDVIERIVMPQERADRADPHGPTGVRSEQIQASDTPALQDELVVRIAALARECAAARGPAQDIEWAFAEGQLFLLQSRPITSLGRVADPDGRMRLWDNSNIVESYRGITTPLTYSFARHAYEGVYRQFCAILGVPRAVIDARASVFANMIGLVRGRVFYNLLNWYRVLAMLPGFRSNRAFMEQMMGVREGLPAEIAAELESTSGRDRWRDRVRLAYSIVRLVTAHLTLSRSIAAFERRLDLALRESAGPYESWRLDTLADAYRDLEARLLLRWDAPLVNDFLAMIFFGVLGKLSIAWCGDSSLQNDLVSGQGGVISAEPARRVRAMAEVATADPALVDLLCAGEIEAAVAALRAHPALGVEFDAYLERFGDRCLEELKLESLTLVDDPTPLVRALGHTARRLLDGSLGAPVEEGRLGNEAEARAKETLAHSMWKPRVFDWVIRTTRARVRNRENLRFERTRLFGRVRRIFLEMGTRLVREGVLDDRRDVFLLTVDELLGYCEGSAVTTDLRGLVAVRRREFDALPAQPAPSDRFETRGAVHVGNAFVAPTVASALAADADLSGIGCCPGVVRGRVRVVRDPSAADLQAGEILVAESTDPGWILLFPLVAALLVERGSLLSHSAIVAREMGIPAIVSIPRVTERLRTGDEVEIDGSTGVVRILATAGGDPGMSTDFSMLRYAQCWEDADVLLDGLAVEPGDTCLSIASAGDNCLSLLTRDPACVIAVDLNATQLAAVRLRMAAYRTLDHAELLQLVGSRSASPAQRWKLYQRCRPHLDHEARAYWDARRGAVERGVGDAGKFEGYFRLFRRWCLPLVHGPRAVEMLLRPLAPDERRAWYDAHWNTRRWRALFAVFFSRAVMGALGRDPAMFAYVQGSVAERIRGRCDHALRDLDASENPYVHWILRGTHGRALPHALRAEHFACIRDRLDRIELRQASLATVLEELAPGSVHRFNASDVFEYLSEADTESLLARMADVAAPGARLVYWNMLAPRQRPASLADRLEPRTELAEQLHQRDKAFFYSRLVIEERTGR